MDYTSKLQKKLKEKCYKQKEYFLIYSLDWMKPRLLLVLSVLNVLKYVARPLERLVTYVKRFIAKIVSERL